MGVGKPESPEGDGAVEVINHVKGVKTRNESRTEYVLYLKFDHPPKTEEEFMTAFLTLLQNVKWAGLGKASELIEKLQTEHRDWKVRQEQH